MTAPNSIFTIVGRSFSVLFRYFHYFLLLALLIALPSQLIQEVSLGGFQKLVSQWLPAHGVIVDAQQATILALSGAEIPSLLWTCLVGAFVAPAMIRVFQRHSEKAEVSFKDMVNFGLSRWSRVVGPYTASQLIIWLGLIVVIPGVLYALFFSFVESVATLDDKVRQPLSRSRKLTRGRRGRIFRTYLLFIPWWGWYATIGPFVLLDKPFWVQSLAMVGNELVGLAIGMSMLQLYLDRMAQLREALDRQEAEKSQS